MISSSKLRHLVYRTYPASVSKGSIHQVVDQLSTNYKDYVNLFVHYIMLK